MIREWDLLDSNRERKERYHEIGRENLDSKKDVAPLAIVIPAPINHAYWRQLMKGDYIDIISNCPFEMHNSLSDEDYSKIRATEISVVSALLFLVRLRKRFL